VQRLDVQARVYLPREPVYDFLVNFPGYAEYSEHLTGVSADGDGGPGTVYQLRFSWWKLTYTAVSQVTAVERPERIDWEIVEDFDAHGAWLVVPATPDAAAPADANHATDVTFRVLYDPDSIGSDLVDIPRFVPFERVLDRLVDALVAEAERIVERVVADLEGNARDVPLDVERTTVEGRRQ
jgi:hypothetical protein